MTEVLEMFKYEVIKFSCEMDTVPSLSHFLEAYHPELSHTSKTLILPFKELTVASNVSAADKPAAGGGAAATKLKKDLSSTLLSLHSPVASPNSTFRSTGFVSSRKLAALQA